VVIAMSILAFGVLAGAAAQVSAIKLTSQSQLRTEAYYLAEQQLEAFRAMTGTSVAAVAAAASYPNDPANPIDPDPNDGLTRAFNRSWTIAADTPEAGLYTLTVRVIWLSALGLPQVVTLETIKVDT
jgi:Tfp pilus assembly protein PilV